MILPVFGVWRVRRLIEEIADLDRREAPDDAFDDAFTRLDAAARQAWGDGYLAAVREALLLGDAKSREWYLCFLTKRLGRPAARAILEEIAENWTNPLNPAARRILSRRR
jgi:hypothetical protein